MLDPFRRHYKMFAGYNAWANARVFEAAEALTDTDYRANRGAFFGSVHGTLNHLLVTDHIWMRRFTGAGDAPDRLDAILFEQFDALRQARVAEDARIVRYIAGLDDSALHGTITYQRVSTPDGVTQPLMTALAHWFNHQTHHRGQVHALLTALSGHAPELDLLAYQRLAGKD